MGRKLYELEQQILSCWRVVDDVDMLYRWVMNEEMSHDDIANVLLGIKTLYNMKFNETFANFEGAIKECYEEKQNAAQTK